jgi:hypothetical protein
MKIHGINIAEALEQQIISARMVPGVKLPSAAELAARLRSSDGKSIIVAVRTDFGQSKLPLPAGKDFYLLDGAAEISGNKRIFNGTDIDFCILMEK